MNKRIRVLMAIAALVLSGIVAVHTASADDGEIMSDDEMEETVQDMDKNKSYSTEISGDDLARTSMASKNSDGTYDLRITGERSMWIELLKLFLAERF